MSNPYQPIAKILKDYVLDVYGIVWEELWPKHEEPKEKPPRDPRPDAPRPLSGPNPILPIYCPFCRSRSSEGCPECRRPR